jgi:membrane protease YdiL (CAAX protease family)
MDAHRGPRSGEFKSQRAASEALNTCLGTLIEQIAKSHNVPPGEVARFFGRRSLAIDVAVNLPFVLLYGFLAGMLVGKLGQRYPPEDGWTAAIVMIVLSSLVFGTVGMMSGE